MHLHRIFSYIDAALVIITTCPVWSTCGCFYGQTREIYCLRMIFLHCLHMKRSSINLLSARSTIRHNYAPANGLNNSLCMNNVNRSSLSGSIDFCRSPASCHVSISSSPVCPVHSQLRSINTSKFRMAKCYYGCFLVLHCRKWSSYSVFVLLFKFLLLRDTVHNICIKYTLKNKGV